jgi:hypothetical protein
MRKIGSGRKKSYDSTLVTTQVITISKEIKKRLEEEGISINSICKVALEKIYNQIKN